MLGGAHDPTTTTTEENVITSNTDDDPPPSDLEAAAALRRAIVTVTDPGRRRTMDGTLADFAALAKLADALHPTASPGSSLGDSP